jgi:hypothetical protein
MGKGLGGKTSGYALPWIAEPPGSRPSLIHPLGLTNFGAPSTRRIIPGVSFGAFPEALLSDSSLFSLTVGRAVPRLKRPATRPRSGTVA